MAGCGSLALLVLLLIRHGAVVSASEDTRCSLWGTHELELNVHVPPPHATAFSDPHHTAVTVTTHMTVDRFAELQRWCWSWLGPMSVAVFAASREQGHAIVREMVRRDICIANYVALHVTWCVAERRADASERDELSAAELLGRAKRRGLEPRKPTKPGLCGKYPFNLQRNVAIEGSDGRTDWAFVVDIDLHLSPLLEQQFAAFSQHFSRIRALSLSLSSQQPPPNDSVAWVVPAVETISTLSPLPLSLLDLQSGLKAKWTRRFYPACPCCYRYPNLTGFAQDSLRISPSLDRSSEDEKLSASAFREWTRSGGAHFPYRESMEPFLVLPLRSATAALPALDDLFIGRHLDKISFAFELFCRGYAFRVLPVTFLVNNGRGDDPGWKTEDEAHHEQSNAVAYFNLVRRALQHRATHVEVTRTSLDLDFCPLLSDSVQDEASWASNRPIRRASMEVATSRTGAKSRFSSIDWPSVLSSVGLPVGAALRCHFAEAEVLDRLSPGADFDLEAAGIIDGLIRGLHEEGSWIPPPKLEPARNFQHFLYHADSVVHAAWRESLQPSRSGMVDQCRSRWGRLVVVPEQCYACIPRATVTEDRLKSEIDGACRESSLGTLCQNLVAPLAAGASMRFTAAVTLTLMYHLEVVRHSDPELLCSFGGIAEMVACEAVGSL